MNMKTLLILLLLALCCACGGGGGSSELFAGTWTARLVPVLNTCPGPTETLDRTWTVHHDGDRVVLNTASGNVFEGFESSETSFVVSQPILEICVDENGVEVPSSTATGTQAITFTNVDGQSADVEIHFQAGNCSENTFFDSTCEIRWQGTATRA